MARVGIKFDCQILDAEIFVLIVKFLDKFAVAADGVFVTRENGDGFVLVDFGKVFRFVTLFESVEEEFEERNGHNVAALLVEDVLFDVLFVTGKPRELGFLLERLVVCAEGKFVEKVRGLFAAEKFVLHIRKRRAARKHRPFHHCRAAEDNARIVLAFLDVALTDHTAVTVSDVEHGKIVSVFEHFGDCALVLNGVEIDVALVVAFHALRRLLGARHTVSAVVVGKNDISVLIEVVCKVVVSASVFRHTVSDLDYALWGAHVVPKIALQYSSVKTLKFFGFHKFSSLSQKRPIVIQYGYIVTHGFALFKT